MKYGLIGEHLSHSFSPIIHSKIADYSYELKELCPEELADFLYKKDFKGINVTIPYKQAVIPYLDGIEASAKEIGSVNTVVHHNGKLYGYNTDFYGMKKLVEKIGVSLFNKKVLILGTGGTSRTARSVAAHLGAQSVITVSRQAKDGCVTYEEAYTFHTDAQFIINTTPCGMYPYADGSDSRSACPIDLTPFFKLEGVLDAIFNPLDTNFVLEAKKRNLPAEGGLYMLVAQAVHAAEIFHETQNDVNMIDRIYQELRAIKENIVLIGMPGCGKSTIGTLLAQELNRPFIDCDEEIVKQTGKQIPDIFRESGEDGFRKIEENVIKNIASTVTGAIIATGGGAVLRDSNVTRLKRNGKMYFLDRAIENIHPTPSRPLSMDRNALQQRYNERYPRYKEVADFHIHTNENMKDTLQVIKEIFFNENPDY